MTGIASNLAERNVPQRLLLLHALGAMVVVDVLDLVAEHRGQFVFAVHQSEQPSPT